MPPLDPTYDNIATQAWPLLQALNQQNASAPATQFLGPAGTAIIARHLPQNWLTAIKIGSPTTVPAPKLDALATAMGYADETALQTACTAFHGAMTGAILWGTLQQFGNGAGFRGITYDDTIFVQHAYSGELELVLHELVHTLQWKYFGAVPFLSKYIQGFVTAGGQYQKNPAEARAYYYQGQFTTAKCDVGLKIMHSVDAAGDGVVVKGVVQLLMQQQLLNITALSAISGM